MAMGFKPAIRWLTLKDTTAELAAARLRELLNQFPILHVFLAGNVMAVAYSHHGFVPFWLTVTVPAVLVAFSVLRICFWLRLRRNEPRRTKPLRLLRQTSLVAVGLAAAYVSWALALNSYAAIDAQAHALAYFAISLVGLIFCLIHLPQAALGVAILATIFYLVRYMLRGNYDFVQSGLFGASLLGVLLLALMIGRVLLNNYRAFNGLVSAKEEAERLQGEIMLLAYTDMLTGLPNRRMFFKELEKQIGASAARGFELALGIIDLDRFKTANDTFGHGLGDELLEMVGARLRRLFGHDQLIARLGGDEFCFALVCDQATAVRLGEEACRVLSEPYRLGENIIHIGASCGIATTADVAATVRTLYDSADYALYQTKTHKTGAVTVYSIDHKNKFNAERAVEMALQAANFSVELDLHLQPIVSTSTGRIVAVEALARWTSPQLGSVRPDVFIPIAERAGLTHNMTLALLRKALSYLRMLPRDVRLSFNLSALDLTSEMTVLAITSVIQQSNIKPSRLLLELTETAAIRDFAAAERSIRTLRALGCSIALDDFGTGQSSLSYLHRLPIDKVKLDRSFLLEAGGASGRELLGAVVALCHSLKMHCVAEGVEDADQLEFLQQIGCDLYQGYYFAKPMPIAELLAFLPRRVADQRLAG